MINKFLENQSGHVLQNYIIPGLKSTWLNGATVRLFEMTRGQLQLITPHSHRFDLLCYVIEGWVTNTIFKQSSDGDFFRKTAIQRASIEMGDYHRIRHEDDTFSSIATTYASGEWYSMLADEIHSVEFSDNARVLFIEGANTTGSSVILEPIVDGVHLETFKTEHWMFTS